MADVDSRFQHLLQPIRDLTRNWEVDVATQLGEYLEEVRGVLCLALGWGHWGDTCGPCLHGGFCLHPQHPRPDPLPVLPPNPSCRSAVHFPSPAPFTAGTHLHFL